MEQLFRRGTVHNHLLAEPSNTEGSEPFIGRGGGAVTRSGSANGSGES